jgi:hypothetical protein
MVYNVFIISKNYIIINPNILFFSVSEIGQMAYFKNNITPINPIMVVFHHV